MLYRLRIWDKGTEKVSSNRAWFIAINFHLSLSFSTLMNDFIYTQDVLNISELMMQIPVVGISVGNNITNTSYK